MKPTTKYDHNIAPVPPVIKMIFAPGVFSIMRMAYRITKKTTASVKKKEITSKRPPRIAAKNPLSRHNNERKKPVYVMS